ncbi:MAG: PH domain-containing protein [Solibacillus sp.]
MMSNEKYKLHPVTAIINSVKALKDLIVPIVIIVLANGFNVNFDINSEHFFSEMLPLLILSLLVVWSLMSGIIKWLTFRYWFEDNELRVEYGLFVKKKRYIPFERIQSLNYKEGIFHRMFGLVQVLVETAGSKTGRPEAELTAVTKQNADEIELRMKQAEKGFVEEVQEEIPQRTIIHQMTTGELLLHATTSSGIGVVLAGIFAAVTQFSEFIPFNAIYNEMAIVVQYSVVLIAFLIAVALTIAWLISVIITFINYYQFTVATEQDRIIVTRGLLEKKRLTIPLQRVQAIKIVENPVRQMLGLCAVIVESAGGGFKGDTDKKTILMPLTSKHTAFEALQNLLPDFDFSAEVEVVPPKRARPFFYRVDFAWLVPVIGLVSYFFYPYGLFSLLLVVPIILLGYWQYRTTGYKITGQQIIIVSRLISRVTFVVQKKRIQMTESRQSYFQKRKQLSSCRIVVMSGMTGATAEVSHLEQQHVDRILDWYEQ